MNVTILKKLSLLGIGIIILSFTSHHRTYQTACISNEMDGYITIKIWDTKKGQKYKPEEARKDAIHAVLYSGISEGNNCVTQAPILNKTTYIENFSAIEKQFFAKNGIWIKYTRSATTETTIPENIGDKKWKVYQVSVSNNELRKYLEEQNIIKSLNNGF